VKKLPSTDAATLPEVAGDDRGEEGGDAMLLTHFRASDADRAAGYEQARSDAASGAVVASDTPPAPRTSRSAVRPEIQALRALAVLLVVIYHLWPSVLPGGFVGVDVFFAISGFLITTHLLREVADTGSVSMPRFWARRARRLLPAALVTLLVCVAATLLFVPTIYWQQFFAEIAASTLYVENWHLAANAVDYLQAANRPSAVQHFWSLGVEEQFYLLWPMLIVLASIAVRSYGAQAQRWSIAIVLLAVTSASLAYSISETANNPAAAFFVTPTRAWEFGAGGLLALLSLTKWTRPSPLAARSTLSWVGIAVIMVAAFTYSAATPFPGWAALLPVLGAIAVIRAEAPTSRWALTPVLKLTPIQFVGNVSYSLYLWHWPLIIFAPFVVGSLTTTTRIIILMLSILAAWLTKVLLEDRFRKNALFTQRRPRFTFMLAGAATAVVIAATAGAALHAQELTVDAQAASARTIAAKPRCFGAASRDPRHACSNPKLRHTVVPAPIEAGRDPNAPCANPQRDGVVSSCEFGVSAATATRTVALVGDSHASMMRAPLDVVAKNNAWRGLSVTRTGCTYSMATKQLPEPDRTRCIQWNRAVPKWFAKHPEVDTVFVIGITGSAVVVPNGTTMFEAKVSGYLNAWSALPATVKHIVAIRDTPKARGTTLQCVTRAIAKHASTGSACTLPRRQALDTDPATVAANRSRSDRSQAVDLTRSMCTKRTCAAVIGGVLVHKDVHHLTRTFATTLAPMLQRQVNHLTASW
jgi:peptidoglycan/LPS O-acetylase OafA/YrhL